MTILLGILAVLPASSQTPDDFNTNSNVGPVYSLALQTDGKVLVGGPNYSIARLNADGMVDASYDVAVDAANPRSPSVNALLAQSDGKVLVGGWFTSLGGLSRTGLGRLNADGSVDSGFTPGVNDSVESLAIQADGKILVAGRFTTVAGQPRTNIARLTAEGTLDGGFIADTGYGALSSQVFALAPQADGKILVGGWFITLAGQPRSYLGRLNTNGTLDASFDPGADNTVLAMAVQADGKILVGGEFTNLAGQPRNFLGRLNADGTLDADFNPGASNAVWSLALQADGKILVGGIFTNLAGQARNFIGRLNANGTPDLGFDPGADNFTASGVQPDGKILVGGGFTVLGGLPRNFLGRLNNTEPATQNLSRNGSVITWLRGGTSPEVWRTTFEHSTNGVTWNSLGDGSRIPGGWELSGVSLPMGGTLRSRGQVMSMNHNGSGWVVESLIGAPMFVTQPTSQTNNFGSTATFGAVAGGPGPLSFQWLKDGIPMADGSGVAGTLTPNLTLTNATKLAEGEYAIVVANNSGSITSAVATLTVIDPVIMSQSIGGYREVGQSTTFTVTAIGTGLAYQWLKNGTPLPQTTTPSLSLTNIQLSDAGMYQTVVMGTYGSVTSVLATLTVNAAGLDTNFNATVNGWTSPVVVQTDGKIIFGGGFTTVGGQSRGRVARVNTNGMLDTTFSNPNANDDVYALALQPDGKLLVGGEFTMLGGQTRYALGRLNTNGTLDTTFSTTVFNPAPIPPITSYRAQAILLQSDGKMVVGGRASITLANGQTLIGGFLLRLNTNGTSDASFSTGGVSGGPISSLAWQPDGKMLIGGMFSTVGGQTRNRIARLNTNGSLDTGFNPGLAAPSGINPIPLAMTVQADGKIVIGGAFTTIAGQSQTNLARLHEDGSLDDTFQPVLGGATYPNVQSVVLQADGRILVGGLFNSLNGVARSRLGRLNTDGTLDISLNPGANSDVYGLAVQPDGKVLVTGFFFQLAGQTRSYIARLNNTEPASQSLSYSNTTVLWSRGGTSPEVWRTTLESSTSGTNWVLLGDGLRVDGGWLFAASALPPGGTVRARGFSAGGGYNAASWFAESRLRITPGILAKDGSFGLQSNYFTFNLNAPAGATIVIEASTNLIQWSPIFTNLINDAGLFLFQDLNSGLYSRRFYRARFHNGALPKTSFLPGTGIFQQGQFTFNLHGIAGQTVIIESSPDLVNWTPLDTNTFGLTPLVFTDPAATNFPAQFYRTRLP